MESGGGSELKDRDLHRLEIMNSQMFKDIPGSSREVED